MLLSQPNPLGGVVPSSYLCASAQLPREAQKRKGKPFFYVSIRLQILKGTAQMHRDP